MKKKSFSSEKIKDIKILKKEIEFQKKNRKTIGLCVGSYDLLHPGHIRHFESAKSYCDFLIVGVTEDRYVRKRKGDLRPIISETLRAYAISQLSTVDFVLISKFEKAIDLIKELQPSYYIKGSDYIEKTTPGITAERKAIAQVGGEMKYTHDEKFSTTDIINKINKKTIKPILLIGFRKKKFQNSDLLSNLAKKLNYMYVNRNEIDDFFTKVFDYKPANELGIKNEETTHYEEFIRCQILNASFQLAERNLENGLNVVLDGFNSDQFNLRFIQEYFKKSMSNYLILKIFIQDSDEIVETRIKNEKKIRNTTQFSKNKQGVMDSSDFDIIFETSDNLEINIDSLTHEIMNNITGDSLK